MMGRLAKLIYPFHYQGIQKDMVYKTEGYQHIEILLGSFVKWGTHSSTFFEQRGLCSIGGRETYARAKSADN